jgi:hypothetical protein
LPARSSSTLTSPTETHYALSTARIACCLLLLTPTGAWRHRKVSTPIRMLRRPLPLSLSGLLYPSAQLPLTSATAGDLPAIPVACCLLMPICRQCCWLHSSHLLATCGGTARCPHPSDCYDAPLPLSLSSCFPPYPVGPSTTPTTTSHTRPRESLRRLPSAALRYQS